MSTTELRGGSNGDLVMKGDPNFLTNIDFSQIDEMDPNLFNGQRPIFDSDMELEVKIIDDTAALIPGSYRTSTLNGKKLFETAHSM